MKRTMTRREIHEVYVFMSGTRLANLRKTEDKVAVLKVLRELRYVAVRYEDDAKETNERLMPKGYEERRRKALAYEEERQSGKQPTAITEADYMQFLQEQNDFRKAVNAAMLDIDKAKVELEYEPVDRGVLEQLMSDCEWTAEQYFRIEEVMTENKKADEKDRKNRPRRG